jgi:uncharacterized secreted protein with C-terminal beta-propeller domain
LIPDIDASKRPWPRKRPRNPEERLKIMRSTLKNASTRNGNPANRTSKIRGLGWLLGAVALLATPACTSDEGEVGSDLEARSTGLVAFESCDGLLDYFQNEATTDLELGLGVGYAGGFRGEPGLAIGEDSQSGAPTAGGAENGDGGSGPGFSTTNVQEAGVDEPDLVKTDGRYLYTVRNGHLLIIEAEGLRTQSDLALDFNAHQILLSGNQVLVLGDRYGAESVGGVAIPEGRRYQPRTVAAIYDVSERAAPRLLRTLNVEGQLVAGRLTGRLARLVVQHEPSIELPAFGWSGGGGTEPSEPPELPTVDGGTSGSGGGSGGGSAEADAGAAEPEPVPMERAQGAQMAYEDAYAEYVEQVKARIAESTIDEWIPQVIDVDAAGQAAERRAAQCGQYYRPGERAGLGSTVVVTLDLDQPGASLPDPAVVSAAGIVYASGENLYLTTVNWRDFIAPLVAADVSVGAPSGGATSGGSTEPVDIAPSEGTSTGSAGAPDAPAMEGAQQAQSADGAEEPDNREATQIHKLALPADGAARYVASGRVHGQLLNQFSLSEYQGHLRIAATEHTMGFFGRGDVAVGIAEDGDVAVARPAEDTAEAPAPTEAAEQPQEVAPPRSVTRVSVFDGELNLVGQTEDVAPNEDIFAVRFIEERGFVVTFERKDPLFTVDLSTPSAPRIVGQLDVLGYSTYLHPVDHDHLLGVGRSADENGFETGMQLSLFDVSDFSAPALDFNLLLGEGWSDAAYDHKALTFYEGMLLLPLSAWTEEGGIDGLEVFDVDVTEGIVRRGTIDHTALAGQRGYAHVERSVVIGDVIYSISNVGLVASGRDDLAEIGHVLFPAPEGDDRPRPDDGDGGTGVEPQPAEDKGV